MLFLLGMVCELCFKSTKTPLREWMLPRLIDMCLFKAASHLHPLVIDMTNPT